MAHLVFLKDIVDAKHKVEMITPARFLPYCISNYEPMHTIIHY